MFRLAYMQNALGMPKQLEINCHTHVHSHQAQIKQVCSPNKPSYADFLCAVKKHTIRNSSWRKNTETFRLFWFFHLSDRSVYVLLQQEYVCCKLNRPLLYKTCWQMTMRHLVLKSVSAILNALYPGLALARHFYRHTISDHLETF